MHTSISQHVPFIKNNRPKLGPRYPRHIQRQLTRKKAAWRRYKQSRSSETLQRYKAIASNYRSLVYAHLAERERKLVDRGNISDFYRHANKKLSSRSVIGTIKRTDGSLTFDSKEKAEQFRQTFIEYYTTDNLQIPTMAPRTNEKISSISFTPSLIRNAISRLRVKSKGGPDKIPTEYIKKCSLWLTMPLTYLFQLSFEYNYIPPYWLSAYITPIFKKGDQTDPYNYRPIALTCVFCKLMEAVIKDQLVTYLTTHNLITKQQHAFLIRHSTTTNLLECTRDWSIALNSRNVVDVIYVDYKRAFDSIVHSKLLSKLSAYGVSGGLLDWIATFLTNRTQQVAIDNCLSEIIQVTSGVIQGSVLGPILFILYINDVSDLLDSPTVHLQLFADDLKLYSSISLSPSVSHSQHLQTMINKIYDWSLNWQLTINTNKCTSTRLHTRLPAPQPKYMINNTPLSCSTDTRDLGIIIDTHLTYNSHITSITTRAAQRVGIVFRCFYCKDPHFLRNIYTTYIRPLLEYNTIIWSPTLIKHIDAIEQIQRSFTKRIPSLSTLPYLQRLKELKLDTLEVRRLHQDLIYYYKILHGLTPHDPAAFFSFHHPPRNVRNNQPLIAKPVKATNNFLSSFSYRAADCFNSLPSSIRGVQSLPSFKRQLVSMDFSRFLYGSCYK